MKILFVTPSYKPAYVYGGPTVSVSELAETLAALGHSVTVYATTANGKQELDVPVNRPTDVNGVTVFYFRRFTGDHTHLSPALWRRLLKTHRNFQVIHLQSWWSFLVLGAAWILKKAGRDFLISPRGMLGAYSFQNQHSLPKKIVHALVGKSLLKASLLHATTQLEWRDCQAVRSGWRGFVAHNLIDLPGHLPTGRETNEETFVFGFLSRIDPKKGLELLFDALANVTFPYRLCIAGTGEEAYLKQLKDLADRLNISDKITWAGWVGGKERFSFLQAFDLFVLPSHNENFAIAVAESLAVGTPVLVSDRVGLADYVTDKGLGWVCETNAASIAQKLAEAYLDNDGRRSIRRRAPQQVAADFDKHRLATEYVSAYVSLIGNEPIKGTPEGATLEL